MQITGQLTDDAILAELGRRLRRLRLQRGEFTQEGLAEEAGVSTATVARIEGGRSTQSTSLIRVLRAMGLVGGLESLVPEPSPSPIELLERSQHQRKRVRPATSESRRGRREWRWDEGGG
jgi:transcriptional regulator with XRE-family HTH domain